MVTHIDSRWVVLAHYISESDSYGLATLVPDWFSGLTRMVYDLALALPVLSMPSVIEALPSHVDIQWHDEVRRGLLANYASENIDHHVHALSYAFAQRAIEEAVDEAYFKIKDGANRQQVVEQLRSSLDTIRILRKEKSLDETLDAMAETQGPGTPSGIPEFTKLGVEEFHFGNINAIGGDTGSFKTTFALKLAREQLKANPKLHVYYFMKEQPAHEVWFKLLAAASGLGYTRILREYRAQYPDFQRQVRAAVEGERWWLERMHVVDQRDFATPTDIAAIVRSARSKHDYIVWYVDYLTRLDFGGRAADYNINLTRGLDVLKNVSLSTLTCGFIINQLVNGWNLNEHKQPMPTFPNRAHIIWSSEVKNLSANILMVYHPASYFTCKKDIFYCTFNKIRHSEGIFRAPFLVDGNNQNFTTVPDERMKEILDLEQFISKGGKR